MIETDDTAIWYLRRELRSSPPLLVSIGLGMASSLEYAGQMIEKLEQGPRELLDHCWIMRLGVTSTERYFRQRRWENAGIAFDEDVWPEIMRMYRGVERLLTRPETYSVGVFDRLRPAP